MERLPSDDVLDTLVDIFDPEQRFAADPLDQPGWKFDVYTGERVYSSAFLDLGSVEAHTRPDELEIRRRQNELHELDHARSAGRRR